MDRTLLPGDPPVEILLRRSGRARRISLRVSSLDGRVTLTVPKGLKNREAIAFATEKNNWIRKHLDKHVTANPVAHGSIIPVSGRTVEIHPANVRRAKLDGDVLHVPAAKHMVGARVKAFLKLHAKQQLTQATDKYAKRVNRSVTKITLRDTRSRWGSCTAKGGLMYSWRLGMAPHAVLDYVAAHEVAHLVELNHSPAYWAIVERICPGYQTHRDWLRTHGATLHSYRFDD